MNRIEAAAAIQNAVDAAYSAYWSACDTEGRAIDPAALDAPDSLLDDAYDAALQIQRVATAHGVSWDDARNIYQHAKRGQ